MAAPYPFHVARPDAPRLAKDLHGKIRNLVHERPDLVPVIVLEYEGRSVVVMDEDDCGFLRRP